MNNVLKFPTQTKESDGSDQHHVTVINYRNGERKILDLDADYQGAMAAAEMNARVFGDRIESIEICRVQLVPAYRIEQDMIKRLSEA